MIKQFKKEQEKQGPALRCKKHGLDVGSFCKQHRLFFCSECLPDHIDHHQNTTKATKKTVKSLLKKSRNILTKKRDDIDKQIENIDSLMKALEYDHEKILKVFETMQE